jgi:hypothetical protein
MARAVCMGEEPNDEPNLPRDYVGEAMDIVNGIDPNREPEKEHLRALVKIIRLQVKTIDDLLKP